ncbi:MAG: type II toxin-antitoxin system VapB family antitoxin [Nocardioides sp.]
MSLNIKNERVHQLAREAAARTNQSQTGAIAKALELYLATLDAEALAKRARIDALLADIHVRMRATEHSALSIEDLYDPETGLPR